MSIAASAAKGRSLSLFQPVTLPALFILQHMTSTKQNATTRNATTDPMMIPIASNLVSRYGGVTTSWEEPSVLAKSVKLELFSSEARIKLLVAPTNQKSSTFVMQAGCKSYAWTQK